MRGQPELTKRKDSPFWYIKIPNGRRSRRISTGETDGEQAQRIFAQFLLERGKPELSDPEHLRVMEMLERYRESKPKDTTIPYHIRNLKVFFRDMAISHITRQSIREYTNQRLESHATRGKKKAERKVAPATVKRELITLTAALNFAVKEGYIREAPRIEKPSDSPPRERWLTPEEFNRLAAACKSDHILLYIHIALNTGARPGAILDLKWFQIDLQNKLIHFNPPGRVQTSKHRPSVPINAVLLGVLQDARKKAKSESVIYHGKGKDGKVNSIKKGFRDACDNANLTGITPYNLRHSAGTWMAINGVDPWKIKEILGHSDLRTTQRYMKWQPSFGRDAVDALATGAQLARKPSEMIEKTKKPKKNSRT